MERTLENTGWRSKASWKAEAIDKYSNWAL